MWCTTRGAGEGGCLTVGIAQTPRTMTTNNAWRGSGRTRAACASSTRSMALQCAGSAGRRWQRWCASCSSVCEGCRACRSGHRVVVKEASALRYQASTLHRQPLCVIAIAVPLPNLRSVQCCRHTLTWRRRHHRRCRLHTARPPPSRLIPRGQLQLHHPRHTLSCIERPQRTARLAQQVRAADGNPAERGFIP